MTLVLALGVGLVGHGFLPPGWDAVISSVLAAVGALHVDPPQ